jgi:hypothetical protein
MNTRFYFSGMPCLNRFFPVSGAAAEIADSAVLYA